jgi:hypothetical protein
LTAGKASVTVSNLTKGTHQITAAYAGSPSFVGSTSPAITQTVK